MGWGFEEFILVQKSELSSEAFVDEPFWFGLNVLDVFAGPQYELFTVEWLFTFPAGHSLHNELVNFIY